MREIKVFKLSSEAKVPTRNTSTDVGLDLYALEDTLLYPSSTTLVKTGVAMQVASGYIGMIGDRSSMALRGLRVGAGVVDPGYSGEVGVVLHNLSPFVEQRIYSGDKIAQMIVYKVEVPQVQVVDHLWESERGSRGFGSSGR